MLDWIMKWVPLLVLLGLFAGLTGCNDVNGSAQMKDVLSVLQEAQFDGHFVFSTGGQLGGGMKNEIYGGAHATRISVAGSVDFASKTRNVTRPGKGLSRDTGG